MTVLEALAILEAAVLECKKRDVNTPEVKEALDFFEPYIWPKWVIPQFRHHVENEREPLENREGQQQVLRATFPGIRDCVRGLLRVRLLVPFLIRQTNEPAFFFSLMIDNYLIEGVFSQRHNFG